MKKTVKLISPIAVLILLIVGYGYFAHLWSQPQDSPITRGSIWISPFVLGLSILLYYSLKYADKHRAYFSFSSLTIITILAGGFLQLSFADSSEETIKRLMLEQNMKINAISDELKEALPDLPEDISNNIVILGNPKAKTVLVNAQGGPVTSLLNFEFIKMMSDAGIKAEDLLLVNVHQYQTQRTEEFEANLISFEDAKKYDAISTQMLADVVSYFKNKGNNVVVMGISFGAFVIEDLLANYPVVADKYIIVVGRLDMPDAVWQEFSKGNYVGFKYDNGKTEIVKFTAEEAGMGGGNSIADKNTSLLAAGLGYKRFTELLKDKDLSKVVYFYGSIDDQVGSLSPAEVDFLKSKAVPITRYESDHGGTIDEFLKNDFKNIIDKVEKTKNGGSTEDSSTNNPSSENPGQNLDPAYRGTISPEHFNTTLDFEWLGNLPVIDVTIDGKEYKFLFDTAAPTLLPETLIKELKLSPITNTDTLHDSSGKQLQTKLYSLPSLKVNDLEFKNFTVLSSNFTTVFPLTCLGLDGVLGYNFLQYMVVKLDLKQQKITFSDQLPEHKAFTPIDIEFEPRYGPLIKLNFAFGNARFQIDTGNNANIQLGTTTVIPEMDKLNYPSRETRGAFVAGFGGAKQNNIKFDYLVKDFSIDNKIHIKAFPFTVDQSNAFLIGENFLKKFTIIIDFPGKKAYFKQLEEGEINEGFAKTFGFTPLWDGKSSLIISAVTSNTPAAKADLKPGDRIVSLNGVEMNEITEEGFCEFWNSSQNGTNSFEEQNSVELVIQRGNQDAKKVQLIHTE